MYATPKSSFEVNGKGEDPGSAFRRKMVVHIPFVFGCLETCSSTSCLRGASTSAEAVLMPYLLALADFREKVRNIAREHKIVGILQVSQFVSYCSTCLGNATELLRSSFVVSDPHCSFISFTCNDGKSREQVQENECLILLNYYYVVLKSLHAPYSAWKLPSLHIS